MLLKDLEKLLKIDIANLSFKSSGLEERVWSYKKAIESLEKKDITKSYISVTILFFISFKR